MGLGKTFESNQSRCKDLNRGSAEFKEEMPTIILKLSPLVENILPLFDTIYGATLSQMSVSFAGLQMTRCLEGIKIFTNKIAALQVQSACICVTYCHLWRAFWHLKRFHGRRVKSGLVCVDVGKFSYNSAQKYWRKYTLMQSKVELSEPLVRGKQMGTPGNLQF